MQVICRLKSNVKTIGMIFFIWNPVPIYTPRVLLSKTILKKRIKIVFRGLYFNSLKIGRERNVCSTEKVQTFFSLVGQWIFVWRDRSMKALHKCFRMKSKDFLPALSFTLLWSNTPVQRNVLIFSSCRVDVFWSKYKIIICFFHKNK